MYFRFEKLEVWRLAREFVGDIYRLSRKFPKDETFGLVSQIRRAAISVMLNIAEGSDIKSDLEFKRFLRISIASLEEVVSALYVALDQSFLEHKEFDILYNKANILASKLNALISKLK